MSMPINTFSESSSGSQIAANGEHLTADNAQDNPVGSVEKYIYVIRNKINDKVYVGQAIDPEERFKGHVCDAHRKQYISAIDGAIFKYGAENFYYEILEDKTPNYNEREKYWIQKLNSKCPNGYNIMDGGEDPPIKRGFANHQSKFSADDVAAVRMLLKDPAFTMLDIANMFGVTDHTISAINKGKTYRDESIKYPIREFTISGEFENMLTQLDVDIILWDLQNTDLSMRQIAIKHGVGDTQVGEVNSGNVFAYRRNGVTYPIRKSPIMPKDTVDKIKVDLRLSGMSKKDIAKKHGVAYQKVSNINSGRIAFDPKLTYPIAKREGVLNYGEEVWEEIRQRLSRNEDARKIKEEMGLPNTSLVHDINNGKSHISDKYTYPIRHSGRKFAPEIIKLVTDEIVNTDQSLTAIGDKYGMHKSFVLQIKNGKYESYRIPGYTYPLR